MQRHAILPVVLLSAFVSFGQYTPPDPAGLEGVIVEKYYVADANDAADTDGGTGLLQAGATVYRVYVDMLDDYKLISVGAYTNHPLTFNTTTTFFNNEDRGEAWADDVNDIYLDNNTVAIDSWLAMGGASDAHWGVLKLEDPDGSVIGGANNDGGSNSVAGGLLVNNTPTMGAALTAADGLFLDTQAPGSPVNLGDAPTIFNEAGSSTYSSEDFAWGVLSSGGVQSPIAGNKVLIGQFTTDGDFSFCLNLYVKIPTELVCPSPSCHQDLIFYPDLIESDTAGLGIAVENKFEFPSLCFNSASASFDCAGIAGGSALPGTSCDDGDPDTENDAWTAQCQCSGSTTSLGEHSISSMVSVYPNPARETLFIAMNSLNGQRTSYALRDALGRAALSAELGNLSGSWNGKLDLSELGSGVYFLEITIGSRTTTERVIVHR